jgi:hypothetical protein
MGRIVTIPIRNVTITASDADFDIVSIGSSADYRGILHMLSLTSNAAAEQFLDLALVTRSTGGSGGTGITEAPVDQGNTRTPSFTAVHSNTTPGTLGNTLFPYLWSMRNELLMIPTPEIRPVISVSSWVALHCATSITGSIKVNGYVVIEEY